jgi:predicted RNA-binding Zn-ribbon protein involved in translation (DUF1610 family)
MLRYDARCPECGWFDSVGPQEMIQMLRSAKKVSRRNAPPFDLLEQLFLSAADKMPCPECGHVGLVVEEARDEWKEEKPCTACGRPIEPERLEFLPDTELCVTCQRHAESGDRQVEFEYCPHCGAPMEIRKSTGPGLTRYVARCSAHCGRNRPR